MPGKSVAHDAPHERKFGDDGEVASDEELDETSTVIAGHDMIAFQEYRQNVLITGDSGGQPLDERHSFIEASMNTRTSMSRNRAPRSDHKQKNSLSIKNFLQNLSLTINNQLPAGKTIPTEQVNNRLDTSSIILMPSLNGAAVPTHP